MKRNSLIVILALLGAALAIPPAGGAQDKIDARLNAELNAADGMISAIVVMADQADLSGTRRSDRAQQRLAVLNELQGKATGSQRRITNRLEKLKREGEVAEYEPYWVFNGIAVTATAEALIELAARSDVARVEADAEVEMAAEPNIALVGAESMWNLVPSVTGEGVVVASLDSGVDASHPALAASYRGGSNSWLDPYGRHLTPYDADGHGTGTMGVMVGSGGIGMAPGAQWIAAKVFRDNGRSRSSAIHTALQWVLDPDGNPTTDDAADVVNNSWTLTVPGCYTDFQADLQALRASDIVPVFSAGNAGPGANTSRSPANLPEALSVGATDNADSIAWFSSQGPSACAGDNTFPDIVAPGVGVRSSDLFDLYRFADGTSFSAPHVAGALALLLSVDPTLTVTHQEAALFESAIDLGGTGPDTVYGNGRLDVAAAYAWLLAGGEDPGGTTTTTTTTTSTTSTTTTSTTSTSTTTTTSLPPGDEAPQAAFSISKKKGVATFNGGASFDSDGVIVSWVWDFGDGLGGFGETVTHTYTANGTYNVTLTVTDDGGLSDSVAKSIRIRGVRN